MTDNMTSYSVVTDNVVVNIEKVEPQAFPGMTFVSLHNPSNLTNCTDHGGSGNMTLRDHVFQTIPGDLQETVERIDISVLSELIFIPHAVFDDSDVRDTLDVNCSWNHSHNSQAIQFVLYENDRLFPSDINGQNDLRNRTNSHESYGGPGSASLLEEGRQMKIGSRVLASKVQGRCVRNLTEPVVIILKHKMKGRTPTCVFWDFDAAGGAGAWSTEGCWVHQTVDDVTECHCNHLTNFALIMDIADQLGAGPLPVEHRTALNWISWLGCGLSMAGLIGTLVALLFVRSLRQLKTTPCHINLSAAMLLAMVSLQVGVKQTDSRVVCGVQAALIQYFLLVSLAWMAVEALLMYQNLVKVVLTPPRFFFCKSCVTAWVVPAIVVTASVSLRWDSYGADDRCWISDAAVFFATFFVPSMIIVVFNSAIFCLVIRAVLVRKVPGDGFTTRRKDRVREARSAIGLMVLLGLTYLFGSFTVGGARLVFQYIFAVTNSIQGFLIFLFFAVIPVYRQRKSKKKRSDLHNKIPPKSRSKISVVSLDVSSRRLRRSSSQSTVESFTDDSEAVRRKVGALPVVEEESSPETDDDGRTSTDIPDETRAPDEPEGQMFRANTETERHDNQRKPNFTSSPHGYCTRGRMFGQGFLRRTQTSTSESQVDLTLWDDEQN
ncbi:adhesion G-protein coupled receptor G2-like [Branchiostoma floridae]|uniref:Adhesion G-protein coupled receptor G2-like n=1 Tax=Branchiostoma floridae TaxID=7739 RepID=A0A9J7N773_BRAFL|nr:adhesion G-protein coupled receptor G2-like [Branchiostoma floridae]